MMAADFGIDKSTTKPPLVVVVDDDEAVREVCVDSLQEAGYRVEGFARGDEALRTLARRAAAVLVVDWRMPGLDGAEVTRRARALLPTVAVLMITGNPGEASAPGRAAGVDRLLSKPFEIADLVSAVASLVSGRRSGPSKGVSES